MPTYQTKVYMEKVVEQIAKDYKAALQELYGDDLAELVLFGTYARGDQHDESDVDFAVVFRDNHPRTLEDKMKISSLGAHLSLKYGLMVSSLSVMLNKKQTSMQGVYQEIRKEGIAI
jgi:uncharacterized protein